MAGIIPKDNLFGNNTKQGSETPFNLDLNSSPSCPKCASKKVWRAAKRYTKLGDEIQRWYCRECGLRFSDPKDVVIAKNKLKRLEEIESESLKTTSHIVGNYQICVTETKNLEAEQQISEVLRRKEIGEAQGKIIEYAWWLKRRQK